MPWPCFNLARVTRSGLAITAALCLGSCGLLPPSDGDVRVAHWPVVDCRTLPGIAGPEDLTIHHAA